MYNETQKNNFIASAVTILSQVQKAVALFGNTEPFERALGKDICAFTLEELQNAADKFFAPKAATRIGQWRVLRDYIKWCKACGIDGAQDHTSEVNIMALDKVRSRMVASPTHLHVVLDQVFYKEDLHNTDNAIRLFCWFMYIGMSGEQAVALKTTDVDLTTNSVVTEGGERYRLPIEAAFSLRSCATQTEFTYIHPLHSENRALPRYDSDQLLRGLRADAQLAQVKRAISVRMKDAYSKGKTKVRLSAERLAASGLYHRIYEQERAGIKPNFRAIAREIAESDGYGASDKPMTEQFLRDKARLLDLDYQTWKLAFNP